MAKGDNTFKPHPRLIHKKNFLAFLYTVVGGGVTFFIVFFDDNAEFIVDFWYILVAITGGVFLVWVIFNILLFRTIVYVLEDNEIISKRGILHKRTRIVPFHAVTNMSIARDPIDRIFGIGTVKLHTAGFSGEKTPEGKIEGITNYTYVYDMLMRKTKVSAKIISDDETKLIYEEDFPTKLLETRKAILQEFIEIKQLFEERRKV